MAFKMSQEFPTASMDITKDFHVLHSAHVYICYSILNAKTYNWLPNSNTHTPATATNKKHLGTSTSLANGHLTAQSLLSCAKFRPLRVTKKIILLTLDWTVGMPAGFAPAKACFKLSSWFGKRHKADAFTKLGNPLSEPQCLPGISDTFSACFTNTWPSFPRFYCIRNKACLLCATPAGTYRVQSPERSKLKSITPISWTKPTVKKS